MQFVPSVLLLIIPSYPAPGPATARILVRAIFRFIVRFVFIVVVLPPVAVSVVTPAGAEIVRNSPHDPAAKVPVAPEFGSCSHPSCVPSYLHIAETHPTYIAREYLSISFLSDTIKAPAPVFPAGFGVTISKLFLCRSFLSFTFVVI